MTTAQSTEATGDQTTTSTSTSTTGGASTGRVSPAVCGNGALEPPELCYDDSVELTFSDWSVTIAFGEANGDGRIDVLHMTSDQVEYSLGDGAGSFAPYESSTTLVPSLAVFRDLNGDGLEDVVSAWNEDSTIRAAFGDGVLHPVAPGSATFPGAITRLAVGNIRDSGPFDVVLAEAATNSVRVYAGLADGIGAEFASVGILNGAVGGLALADLNADGRDDVLLAGTNGSPYLRRYLASGAGLAAASELLPQLGVAGDGIGEVSAADFDGDGNVDVAAAVSNGVIVGFSDGLGGYEDPIQIPAASIVRALHANDLNADGRSELLIGLTSPSPGSGNLHIVRFDDRTYTTPIELDVAHQVHWLDTADANEDGGLDIVVAPLLGADGSATVFLSTP